MILRSLALAALSLTVAACNPLGKGTSADPGYAPGLPDAVVAPELAGLSLSAGSLSPAFAAATTSYIVSVPNAVSSLEITPAAASGTDIKVNGAVAVSGSAAAVTLNTGDNAIEVVVANSSSSVSYSLHVRRQSNVSTLSDLSLSAGSLSPAFASGTTNYSVAQTHAISSMTLTATAADTSATLTVNGSAVASGAASSGVAIGEGMNIVTVACISEDQSSTTNYVLVVGRPAPIRVTAITATSINLSWPQSVGTGLTYKVYMSAANPAYQSFDDLSEVTAGTLKDTLTDAGTDSVSTGISATNSYFFNVVVSDSAGHQVAYTPVGDYFTSAAEVYWPFNNDSLDVAGSNNGVRSNSPTIAEDRFGFANGSWHFSHAATAANAPYINSASLLANSGATAQTLSFWMKADSINNSVFVPLSAGDEAGANTKFGIYWNGSPSTATVWGGDFGTTDVLTTNWTHWVVTYDGSTLSCYKNGVFVLSQAVPLLSVSDAKLVINYSTTFLSNYTGDFTIDEVRHFKTGLDATAVGRLYTATRP